MPWIMSTTDSSPSSQSRINASLKKKMAWGFFDGPYHSHPPIWRAGNVLCLNEHTQFCPWSVTNKTAELPALLTLLCVAYNTMDIIVCVKQHFGQYCMWLHWAEVIADPLIFPSSGWMDLQHSGNCCSSSVSHWWLTLKSIWNCCSFGKPNKDERHEGHIEYRGNRNEDIGGNTQTNISINQLQHKIKYVEFQKCRIP